MDARSWPAVPRPRPLPRVKPNFLLWLKEGRVQKITVKLGLTHIMDAFALVCA